MFSWKMPSGAEGVCLFAGILIVLQMSLIAAARTDATLVSVWQVLPWTVAPLFALVWVFLWWFADRLRDRWQVILAVLLAAIAFGTSWGIYVYGFGFDPFIHQAAARYLAEHRTIALPSPLYAGYYGILAIASWITPFSISHIDRALVPVSMVVFMAWWVTRGAAMWSLPRWVGWSIFLLPYGFATFSVPYHLSVVFVIVLIAALPRVQRSGWWVVALAGLALIHPLLLVPASALVAAKVWWVGEDAWWKQLMIALVTCGGIVALFWVYATQGGGLLTFPTWMGIQRAFSVVTGFPFAHEPLSAVLSVVWRTQHVWLFAATLLGAVGLISCAPQAHQRAARTLVSVMIGVATALVLVAAGASFENILPSEQYEFSLRLRNVLPWLVFPGLGYLLQYLSLRCSRVVVGTVCLPLIAVIWYTSYPLYAPGTAYAAPGLGRGEVEAFEQVERVSEGNAYAALAPQMVSAAALRSIGFERSLQTVAGERYPYAIPTGGELYALYLQLWTERDPQDVLNEACAFARVPQIMVVLPTAWDPNSWIDVRLAPITIRWITADARHRIYRYSCE